MRAALTADDQAIGNTAVASKAHHEPSVDPVSARVNTVAHPSSRDHGDVESASRTDALASPWRREGDAATMGLMSAESLTLQRRPFERPRGTPAPVICAIDDDGLADAVLATGARLAERLNVPLTVVHSPHPSVFIAGAAHRAALERGNALMDRVTDGYDVDERVVEADEPGNLISALAREGASMIVLGARRRTGLPAAILGSVSQGVIADADCPVVTVSALMAAAAISPKAIATET
jgi:nucleotide-binding universal stress UspA family protein